MDEIDEEILDIQESDYSESEEEAAIPPPKPSKHRTRSPWTTKEDNALIRELKQHGNKFTKIQESVPHKSISCIRTRIDFLCAKDPSLNVYRKAIRHIWTDEEDAALIKLVRKWGDDWNRIGRKMQQFDRSAQQCRTR